MKSLFRIIFLLLIVPFNFVLAPLVFSIEYRIFKGHPFDPGISGIAYLGTIIPGLMILMLTLIIFVCLKAFYKKKGLLVAEYQLLILIYLLTLLIIMNPYVIYILL